MQLGQNISYQGSQYLQNLNVSVLPQENEQTDLANPSIPPFQENEQTDLASEQYQMFCANLPHYCWLAKKEIFNPPILSSEQKIKIPDETQDLAYNSIKLDIMDKLIEKIKRKPDFYRNICKTIVDSEITIPELEKNIENTVSKLKQEERILFDDLKKTYPQLVNEKLQFNFLRIYNADISLDILLGKLLLVKIDNFVNIFKSETNYITELTTYIFDTKKYSLFIGELIEEIKKDPDFHRNFCELLIDENKREEEKKNISEKSKKMPYRSEFIFNNLKTAFQSAIKELNFSLVEFKNADAAMSIIIKNELAKEIETITNSFRNDHPQYLKNLLTERGDLFLRESEGIELSIQDQKEVALYLSTFVNETVLKINKESQDLSSEVHNMNNSQLNDFENSLEPGSLALFRFLTKESFIYIQKTWNDPLFQGEQAEKALMSIIKNKLVEKIKDFTRCLEEATPQYLKKISLYQKGLTYKEKAADNIKEPKAILPVEKAPEKSYFRQAVDAVKHAFPSPF